MACDLPVTTSGRALTLTPPLIRSIAVVVARKLLTILSSAASSLASFFHFFGFLTPCLIFLGTSGAWSARHDRYLMYGPRGSRTGSNGCASSSARIREVMPTAMSAIYRFARLCPLTGGVCGRHARVSSEGLHLDLNIHAALLGHAE